MEATTSYWQATTSGDARAPLPGDIDTEVCVVGAGITGLTTAYLLARDGVPVVLVEAGSVGGGVTGSTTGKVTALHRLVYADLVKRHGQDAAARYARAQLAGMAMIAEAGAGIECDLGRAPACTYTRQPDRIAEIEREVDAAQQVGLTARFTDTTELPFEVAGAIVLEDQLLFHPRKYCLGLAEEIVRNGGAVYERTRARGIGRGRVETDHGAVTARAIVLATQAPIVHRGLFFARTTPMRSYALAAEHDALPAGMYVSLEEPTRSVRPHPATGVLIVGGGGHRTGRGDHAGSEFDALEQWARDAFSLEGRWRWSAQDFEPADGLPYIGRVTPASDVYVATGFAKWGLATGSAAAIAIADDIAGRQTEWAAPMAASRIAPIKEGGMVLAQGAETARSMTERVAPRGAKAPEDLEPGEGTVIRRGVSPVAVHRDEGGRLRAVSAVCSHLGCVVHFNDAERSWDCPCHGSRFDLDGAVLNGPATEPLDQVDL